MFSHYLINSAIFGKKIIIITHKRFFWFSTQNLVWNFLILRRNDRDMIKDVYCCSSIVTIISVTFDWNLNYLDRFRNILKYKTSWKSSSGSRVAPCGRTYWHDEANIRFSLFCKSTKNSTTQTRSSVHAFSPSACSVNSTDTACGRKCYSSTSNATRKVICKINERTQFLAL
jgi:hypothetical protein